MVATERVVQVEADNIAVRQAKVFAHCGCRVNVRGTLTFTARTCA